MRILSINDIMRIPRAHNPSCSALRCRRLTEGLAGLPVKVLAAGRHELRAQGRRLRANAKVASRFAVAYRTGVLIGRSRDATKAYQDRPIATTRDGGDRGDGKAGRADTAAQRRVRTPGSGRNRAAVRLEHFGCGPPASPRDPTSACNTVGSKYMPAIWAHLGRRLSWSPGPQATSRRPSSANGQIGWSRRTSLEMVQFEVLPGALPNHALLRAVVVLWSVAVPASDFSAWLVAVPTSVGGG